MSDTRRFEGTDGRSGVDTVSPVMYFPNDPDMVARRLTIYTYGEPVFFHDYIVHEGTMYALYVEAMPNFRDGKWLEYINFGGPTFEKNYEIFGKYDREVWLNVTPYSSESILKALEKRADLTQQDLMIAAKINVTGDVVMIYDTDNPENNLY